MLLTQSLNGKALGVTLDDGKVTGTCGQVSLVVVVAPVGGTDDANANDEWLDSCHFVRSSVIINDFKRSNSECVAESMAKVEQVL